MFEDKIIVQDRGFDAAGLAALMQNNRGIDPGMLALANNGGGFGGNNGGVWWIFIVVLFLLWGRGGWGGNGDGCCGGNGVHGDFNHLATELNDDNNTQTLLRAIEGNECDIQNLATTLNCDINMVKSAIDHINTNIASLACDIKLSGCEVVNAITAGNADLAARLAECCCNTQRAIDGVNLNLTKMSYEDRLAMCEQTNTLTNAYRAEADKTRAEIASFRNAWEAKNYQDVLSQNARLQTVLDLRDQQSAFNAYTDRAVAPLSAQLGLANSRLETIECHQLPTYAQAYVPGTPVVSATLPLGYAAPATGYNYGCGC